MEQQPVRSCVRIACGLVLGIVLWHAAPVHAVMRLEIAGIPGEAVAPLPGQIEVLSFSLDNVETASQRAAKKAEVCGGKSLPSVQSAIVTKVLDKASPKLFQAAALGTALPTVTLHLFKSGPVPVEYATIELTNALVAAIHNGGSTTDDLPTETVRFSYGQIKWTYVTDGSGGPPETSVAAWSVCEP